MRILVLNCGSSSIKYQFINTEEKVTLAKGVVDRIGMSGAVLSHTRYDGDTIKIAGEILDHQMGIEYVLGVMLSKNHGVIDDKDDIDAVGHRVVHGGETFSGSVLITNEVISVLQDNIELAPLHNPPNIKGIQAVTRLLPGKPQVGVFDTSFHLKMPPKAFLYGIPYELYKKHKIRRYGFHGTSHRFVSQRAAEILGKKYDELKIVTAHLGNGCSMAAVDKGHSIDTTMGFTPLEGLLMGTRSGDLDPSLILYIMGKEGLSLNEAGTLLNKHSGLIGISGESSDMREILAAIKEDHKRSKYAFEIFCYRIKKYVGAYAAAMGGLDAFVFTGGIGENSSEVREEVCRNLEFLGIQIDDSKNKNSEEVISVQGSKVAILKIPTNEELVIALDTSEIVISLKESVNLTASL
ncbi:MAG: acetate kinase [Ignavibacteria bacterium RIFOXYB2_FULL_35_12]|nr:MAG: acetate kinase [Ignavibacteria bacterium GWA2_36_19]OGU51199.1 MAG: acetate kinase [Ignavibacteria bacterium GWC2_35_8]OGU60081.1 MAG: acetate kinase [Ignavibacteria bacterium GWF2_35_20]OGU83926.1 MAG: acetate kinase [Ignavibacteria bacterium RIFOXYA12_FULL_35_25]OGU88173.1 MAG: acetate kinase [Ignavibacteria bacterium RIFOXYC12_FULL_35_11]OGU94790.1 MAG: acetate kinase [Ignavibacteria bacterium RIFOXYB12_FULL_35_14]OGU98682.1 MAG: acetate kinase [Ignavibacteria bacterium RIFOXYC2_FU